MKNRMGKNLSIQEVCQKITSRVSAISNEFVLMILRWVGFIPSHSVRRILYKIFGIKIGSGSKIHMWASFFKPSGISIGEDTLIGDHCFLDGRSSLKIGSHTDIASQGWIYN